MSVNVHDWLAPFGIEAPGLQMEHLTLDSREVAIHSVFVALAGHQRDGRDFIPQAISLGAKVILAQTDEPESHGELEMREHSVIVYVYQLPQKLSALAGAFYGQPSHLLDVIAVTGTNGKTSTVQLLNQLANQMQIRSGSIGTLGAGVFGELSSTANTTPEAISMQRLLAEMHSQGATQVAMEASSIALVQHRIADVQTKVAVFTNLTRDHLDYHGDMPTYAAAKRLLLQQPGLQWVVLNQHDHEHVNWLTETPNSATPILIGFDAPKAPTLSYVIAKDIEYMPSGTAFTLDSSWGSGAVTSTLMGKFNVMNLLAAVASQLCLGQPLNAVVNACADVSPVAGRMECFSNDEQQIVVDYAHTPDALEQVLKGLSLHTNGKLISVFGCGGERDQGKRPMMGEIAERLSDVVVLTDDNSRSESPQQIATDILSGCKKPEQIQYISSRQEAIQAALAQARKEDVVLVAGKGHEDYQIIGSQKNNYNERQYVSDLLKEMLRC